MPVNPYFTSNHNATNEQALYQSLIIEAIKIHGRDMYYVPREYVALDRLYGEDKLSAFTKAYQIEFYVDLVERFGGDRDLLSKFGLEVRDEMTLTVAKQRFADVVTLDNPAITRPREGDIIYFPTDKSLFEITFMEPEQVFYMGGNLYTYEISLKRFEVAGEKFDTGIDVIDSMEDIHGYTDTIVFVSGTGDFVPGERVTQSLTEGEVVSWDLATKTLVLVKVKGEFAPAIDIVGVTSGAAWQYDTVDDVEKSASATLKDNVTLDDLTSGNVDFTETNPYSS